MYNFFCNGKSLKGRWRIFHSWKMLIFSKRKFLKDIREYSRMTSLRTGFFGPKTHRYLIEVDDICAKTVLVCCGFRPDFSRKVCYTTVVTQHPNSKIWRIAEHRLWTTASECIVLFALLTKHNDCLDACCVSHLLDDKNSVCVCVFVCVCVLR